MRHVVCSTARSHADTSPGRSDMQRVLRIIMPFVAAMLAVLDAIDFVAAVQEGRIGRAVWKAFMVLLLLFVAYMLYETGRRIKPEGELRLARK